MADSLFRDLEIEAFRAGVAFAFGIDLGRKGGPDLDFAFGEADGVWME